jgi:hypothetical protein
MVVSTRVLAPALPSDGPVLALIAVAAYEALEIAPATGVALFGLAGALSWGVLFLIRNAARARRRYSHLGAELSVAA